MKTFNVRQLKNNPSETLHEARKHPVVVMKRDHPEALLVHFDDEALLTEPGVRRAFAAALYREESLSLGQAAGLAGLSVAEFSSTSQGSVSPSYGERPPACVKMHRQSKSGEKTRRCRRQPPDRTGSGGRIRTTTPALADTDRFPELDGGEASVLALSLNHGRGCLVLMDEPAGRRQARAHGLLVTGLAGVPVAARKAGIVKRIRPFFERLAESDFSISDEIIDAVLKEAGEA